MNKDLVLETKPQFNAMVKFCTMHIAVALGITYVLSFIVFITFVILEDKVSSGSAPQLYRLICMAIFLFIMLVMLFFDKMNYLATKYQLYPDKIYFEEGFLNFKSKAVNLADIKEVHYTQSFFQRAVGLGTVKFLSPANTSTDNYHNQSVEFKDISNGQEVYEKAKEIFGLKNDLILETKPKFSLVVNILPDTLLGMVTILCSFVLFSLYGFFDTSAQILENKDVTDFFLDDIILVHIPILLVIAIIATLIIIQLQKKRYVAKNYKIFTDCVEFNEGFINYRHKFIKMTNIKEIHLLQSFFQRKAELGTIRFVSAGTGTIYDGISFYDIPNSLAVYTKVKQLHQSQT